MQKIILLSISVFLYSQVTFSQNSYIKGTLSDSSANNKLSNAVISVLNAKDSTLAKFSRSNSTGKFSAGPLPQGDYLVMITYPKYGEYIDKVSLDGNTDIDLTDIYLVQTSKLLEEIIIRQQSIRIKGDTTEFTADSFYVKPNATVEDLLKELPGVQVDKNGQITAQGQRVQKVLVDGEEFFSDDPTIATRNLRADAVDKVQVFDKKSDQAEFSGIDDGEKTRTLNLKLKDNAKRGYFGKLSAAGLDQYYNVQAMINAFKAKRKISAFAIASSTDQTGLNFQESSSYGFTNSNIQIDDGSGAVFITGGDRDDLSSQSYYGQGLPESMKAGIHYSNKWKEDKYHTGGNYLFNKLAERSAGNTYRQNILEDSLYYDRESATSNSDRMRHSLSGLFEFQIDSSSNLKITANGHTGTSDQVSHYDSEALSEENKLVNSSVRNTRSISDNSNLSVSALYRKKFKKKGRTFSLSLEERFTESESDGFLYNSSEFFLDGNTIIRRDTTDQNKFNSTKNNVLGAKATYTEPLSAKSFLEFNYAYNSSNSLQKRLSYDKDINAKYTDLVDSLSNEFKYIYNTNSAGLSYRYNAKKYNFSIGGNVANTAFQQSDLVKDTTRKYNYYNFFPRANFNYKFSSFSNISIRYNGNTTQPTIDQLQPLTNNDDPLNIRVGNPSLKQQFRNSINLTYTNFQIINERYVFLGTFITTTKDQISSSYTIDELGRRVTRYVNTDGNYTIGVFGGFSMKIPKSNTRLNFRPGINNSKYTNYVNGILNVTKSNSLSLSTGVNFSKKEVYNLNLTATPSYTSSKSSISKVAGTNYWQYRFDINADYQLPWKLEIGTTAEINLREKINATDLNNNVVLWNAYIEKKFMKSEALTLRASINDILDQNKGYSRVVQPFAIEEKNYLTYKRYGLLTLTYNFNNKGGAGAPKDASIRL